MRPRGDMWSIDRGRSPRWIKTYHRGGLKITYLYSTWTRLTGGTMTNRCFCYIRGNIRGEYEFTVLLLLSGAIKYIPPKQQRKTSYVEYNMEYIAMHRTFVEFQVYHKPLLSLYKQLIRGGFRKYLVYVRTRKWTI